MKPRALVIAEDNTVRRSLAQSLEHEDYCVLSARDEEEGIDLFRGSWIDIVVVDVPGEAGWQPEAIGALKAMNPFVPHIALVENLATPLPRRDIQADALIFKPVNVVELLRAAKQLVTETSESRVQRISADAMARPQDSPRPIT